MAKILLVEDDKSLREIYGVRLMAEGYEIVSAGDGEEALAMAIKERPNLIVSDVMMPKISGFDMLDILRSTSETKDVKVIMMTALSSDDQRARGEALGADRYLVKSQVGIEDVVRTVHDVLGDSIATPTPAAPSFSATPAPAPVAPAPVAPAPQPAPVAPQPVPEPIAPVAQAAPAPAPAAPVAPAPAAQPVFTAAPQPAAAPAYAPEPVATPVAVPTPNPAPALAPAPAAAPVVTSPAYAPEPLVAPGQVTPPAYDPAPVAPQPVPEPVAPVTQAAPAPAPVAPAPVAPAPQPSVLSELPANPAPLPQPTAPFSTPAPASLGERIIEPLTSPSDTLPVDIASQMEQALNTPQQQGPGNPPVPPAL